MAFYLQVTHIYYKKQAHKEMIVTEEKHIGYSGNLEEVSLTQAGWVTEY